MTTQQGSPLRLVAWNVRGGDTLPDAPRAAAATVPAWLVERLLFTVGLPEDEIRAMTADEARAAWDAWRVRPR